MESSETIRRAERKCASPGCNALGKPGRWRADGTRQRGKWCPTCIKKRKGIRSTRVCIMPGCERLGKSSNSGATRSKYCPWHYAEQKHGMTKTEYEKHIKLVRKYGISLQDFKDLLNEQDGTCAICAIDMTAGNSKYATVDHDHDTGEVRGLLCQRCNRQLAGLEALFKKQILVKAMRYLAKSDSAMNTFVKDIVHKS